jgi:flagellar biosynthesis protein FlhA
MSPLDALNVFAILSIGNALLTTLPAFLLSTAMGLMVTRVAADGSLGVDLVTQLLARPGVLRAAGVFALALALVPALPRALFALLGVGLFGLAAFSDERRAREVRRERATHDAARRAAIRRPEMALGLLGVDALAIDIGLELGPLLLAPLADRLLDRIGEVRRALAADIGIVLPGVRLRDDAARDPSTYAVRVRDTIVGEGRLRLDALLAVADENVLDGLPGERVREPVYGMPALWIAPAERERATARGALVFDPVSILGSHLAEAARRHASALLGRQELHTLLEHLRATVPSLVKEIGGDGVPLALVQRVFEGLLRERIWPRDIVATLEALVEAASVTRDPRELIEAVRRALVPRQLRQRAPGALEPLLLAPAFEAELQAWLADGSLAPRPEAALHLRATAADYLTRVARERAALVSTAALRSSLAEFLQRFGIALDVYAYGELPPELELRPALVVEAV